MKGDNKCKIRGIPLNHESVPFNFRMIPKPLKWPSGLPWDHPLHINSIFILKVIYAQWAHGKLSNLRGFQGKVMHFHFLFSGCVGNKVCWIIHWILIPLGGLAFDKTGEVHLLFTTTALCEKQIQNSVPLTFHQVARVRWLHISLRSPNACGICFLGRRQLW